MSPHIRPIRREDLEPVLEMWARLFRWGSQQDPRLTPTDDAVAQLRPWARETWLDSSPFPQVWVADDHGPVGFVHLMRLEPMPVLRDPPTVRIGNAWVEPSHRGAGVGRALVEAALEAAREAGHPRVMVGTLTADHRAIGFWKALGFGDWQVLLRRDGEP